jgi:hypothetical protein
VRRVQAAMGRLPVALLGGKSLQLLLRVGKFHLWSRSQGPRGRPSGKDRLGSLLFEGVVEEHHRCRRPSLPQPISGQQVIVSLMAFELTPILPR